jgi:peptidoglycan-associated lipoprotein
MSLRSSCLAVIVLVAPLAPVLMGCTDNKAAIPPALTPASTLATQSRTEAPATTGKDAAIDTGGLHVSDAIARACGLPRKDSAPRFDYDSATIAPKDRELLAAIARCLVDGALRGQSLALVGRADPRGEDEYNMGLGESRADTVQRYLHDLGVGPDHVRATSRGKMDAKGTDEESWAVDRRVDIELATR